VPQDASAVRVDNVSKTFRIPKEHVHTFKERALHPFRRTQYRELAALRDVSFTVAPGEFYGIVGRNGSGKSTLLKCMAGIYATDRGRIYVDGRLSSFIELGVGFNPDLPARDNILLNAAMLGLSPREARRRVDAVLEFAELEEFAELKLKNYSSGMSVRLAFAVMIQVDAEVLLIDEVLAVGDAAFQQKCYDQFAALRQKGVTLILVTHDMAAVQKLCDRAMLIERGEVLEISDPEHVGNHYLELNFGRPRRPHGEAAAATERLGDARARIVDAWFEDENGARTDVLPTGRRCTHAQKVVFAEEVLDPVFTVVIENLDGAVVVTADEGLRHATGAYAAGEEVTIRTTFENVLAPDSYVATPAVADGGGLRWIDRPEKLQHLTVTGTRATAGIVELPFTVAVERSQAREGAIG
jgi:ABC-type polysaccharide/polyol phosphate transport system ATPase subunit